MIPTKMGFRIAGVKSVDRELRAVFDSVRSSAAFAEYADAFQTSTGLGLELIEVGSEELSSAGCEIREFCKALGTNCSVCHDCQLARRNLHAASSGGERSVPCAIGFLETFIPVSIGHTVLGWLRTTPVVPRQAMANGAEGVRRTLSAEGVGAQECERLGRSYSASRAMDEEKLRGVIGILKVFADLVGALACDVACERTASESSTAGAACRFIDARLDAPIPLGDIAEHVHVSPYHLSRLFREKVGMTITEYIGRRRVESAQAELARTGRPVTEIAFDVGFQSLSQFNRSFQKFAGCSPTRWRESRNPCPPAAVA